MLLGPHAPWPTCAVRIPAAAGRPSSSREASTPLLTGLPAMGAPLMVPGTCHGAGRDFDALLASFRFGALDALHHQAHRFHASFDEVSTYETALTAVASAYEGLHLKLLSTKAKLGELAPLLFSAASAAKSETLANDIAVHGAVDRTQTSP